MQVTDDDQRLVLQRREQLLRLVAKGFHRELIKYGVDRGEVVSVAAHLLDNVVSDRTPEGASPYGDLFRVDAVVDRLASDGTLGINDVTLRALAASDYPVLASWLEDPAIRESFIPTFPGTLDEVARYFAKGNNEYFCIVHDGHAVGIVGGEQIDVANQKLEMKKLVGHPGLRGKGIGKAAVFGFLYYAFVVRQMHKVYVNSRDINIRNVNLNSRFGFEIEGIFFEELSSGGRRGDVVRMALLRPIWLALFG